MESLKGTNAYINTMDATTVGIANDLIRRMNVKNLYLTSIDGNLSEQITGNVKQEYIKTDVMNAEYDSYLFYDICDPLDIDILSKMAAYEPHILKMIERCAIYTHELDFEARVTMYYKHLRYWNFFLDRAEIDFAVFFNLPHAIFDYVLFCLCKIKNIPVVSTYFAPWGAHLYMTDDIYRHGQATLTVYKRMAAEYKDVPIESIALPSEWERMFLSYAGPAKDMTPYYMHQSIRKEMGEAWLPLQRFFQRAKTAISFLRNKDWGAVQKSLLKLTKRRDHIVSTKKMWREYEKFAVIPDDTASYIYFPLHYEPEQTTCPQGGWFVHQLLAIQMISYHLPENVYLYVKEHPNQPGFGRDIRLYKQIAALKNCVMVERNTDTYRLIDHCVAVATITGTAGWEGLFRNKPFLMFGYHLYMHAPGVFHIQTNEDMKRALASIFAHGPAHTLKDLKIFVKAVSETTFYGFDEIALREFSIEFNRDENALRIANDFASFLQSSMDRKGDVPEKDS